MLFFLKYYFFLSILIWQIQQIYGENQLDNAIDGLKIALNGEIDKIEELKRDKADRVEVNQMVNFILEILFICSY